MLKRRHSSGRLWPVFLCALPMLALMVLPIIAIITASSPADLLAGVSHPLFAPALWLSAKTTLFSLVVVVVTGTPLAWWLARSPASRARWVELLVDLPIVLPPAVVVRCLLPNVCSKRRRMEESTDACKHFSAVADSQSGSR